MSEHGLTGAREPHTFHVCAATQPFALCGDSSPENWLIREEWVDHLAPESICDQCLALLRASGKAAAERVFCAAEVDRSPQLAR